VQLERDLDAMARIATRRLRDLGQAPDGMQWGETNVGLHVHPEIANLESCDEQANGGEIELAYLAHKVNAHLQHLLPHFP
jgi:hypothetical protein